MSHTSLVAGLPVAASGVLISKIAWEQLAPSNQRKLGQVMGHVDCKGRRVYLFVYPYHADAKKAVPIIIAEAGGNIGSKIA